MKTACNAKRQRIERAVCGETDGLQATSLARSLSVRRVDLGHRSLRENLRRSVGQSVSWLVVRRELHRRGAMHALEIDNDAERERERESTS